MIEVAPQAKLIWFDDSYKVYMGYAQCVKLDPIPPKDHKDSMDYIRKRMAGCHESPLEHASATFQITCSRACSHQLVRHRLASFSQVSQRYCVEGDDLRVIVPPSIANNEFAKFSFFSHMKSSIDRYKEMVAHGIPAEDARFLLPNATATRLIVTMNYRELIHFFGERMCNKAQWEIRNIASQMLKPMKNSVSYIFENIGPKCRQLGRCPEGKSCGWWAVQ